ncbi:MAG TPA: hypothetical protein VN493_31525 [Thermoanaerobaculia bacterium]|nr:hypothetical protein [Thermoanaerobaculia bacterium]
MRPSLASARLALGALLGGWLVAAAPAQAHNAKVHRDMTDRAYEIMLALSAGAIDTSEDPALAQLAQDATTAIQKLRNLPARLPSPQQSVCVDPATVKMLGTNTPNWGAPSPFEDMTLGAVPFPISTAYITGVDCGIDPSWSPGAFFTTVNPPGPGSADHTGVVLGFWAHQPDDEVDDWHIYFRPTNMVGFSLMKEYMEDALALPAGAIWVTLRCALECAGSVLTLGIVGDCKDCIDEAIQDSKNAVHEGLTTVDGLFPGFGDHTNVDAYTGMGHHLNVVSSSGEFDDRSGLLVESAGPNGVPDPLEILTMLAADTLGMTVHHDPSLGPKRYEILGAQDFHPNSVDRDEDDWQFLSFPHTPFTPLDNLAHFGWQAFRANPQVGVRELGWPLHAIGDAIVPMHVAGTFGWGHRPYEDAFERRLSILLSTGDVEAAKREALAIAKRALVWRKLILDWRAQHPGQATDIPVRDLITQLATQTLARVQGPSMLVWPFNPLMSPSYVVPGPTREGTITFYETIPGSAATNKTLLEEGIAAEIAFLVSAGEVLP